MSPVVTALVSRRRELLVLLPLCLFIIIASAFGASESTEGRARDYPRRQVTQKAPAPIVEQPVVKPAIVEKAREDEPPPPCKCARPDPEDLEPR